MLQENIRNLRKAKGWSQEELAIKLNVVRQTVSKWEKGVSHILFFIIECHIYHFLSFSTLSQMDSSNSFSESCGSRVAFQMAQGNCSHPAQVA